MPILLIPIYNEEDNLSYFFEEIIKFTHNGNFKFLLINDGSIDNSERFILNFKNKFKNKVYYLKNKKNIGLSKTIKKGLIFSLNNLYDFFPIITIDSDNQHDINKLNEFIEYFKKQRLDFLTISRDLSKYSLYKRTGNLMLSKLASFLLKRKIYDIETGFRLINKKAATVFIKNIVGIRYSLASEFCYIAHKYKLNFENTLPINTKNSRSRTKIIDFIINISLGLFQYLKPANKNPK